MDKSKSRLAELLGVEVGEVFSFEYRMALKPNEYFINDCGIICFAKSKNPVDVLIVYDLIERPDAIIRKPRFSDEEMTVLRWFYKRGVKRVQNDGKGDRRVHIGLPGFPRAPSTTWIDANSFPALRPGEIIDLEAMFGKEGADNG